MSKRREALAQIQVGATYRHLEGHRDVVVTEVHEPTGRVWWRDAAGPGLADAHRNLYCEEFLTAYTRRDG